MLDSITAMFPRSHCFTLQVEGQVLSHTIFIAFNLQYKLIYACIIAAKNVNDAPKIKDANTFVPPYTN